MRLKIFVSTVLSILALSAFSSTTLVEKAKDFERAISSISSNEQYENTKRAKHEFKKQLILYVNANKDMDLQSFLKDLEDNYSLKVAKKAKEVILKEKAKAKMKVFDREEVSLEGYSEDAYKQALLSYKEQAEKLANEDVYKEFREIKNAYKKETFKSLDETAADVLFKKLIDEGVSLNVANKVKYWSFKKDMQN